MAGGREFASGGYARIWRGELVERNSSPREVCIKAITFRVNDGEGARSDIEKVDNSPSLLPGLFTQFITIRHSVRRSLCGCD